MLISPAGSCETKDHVPELRGWFCEKRRKDEFLNRPDSVLRARRMSGIAEVFWMKTTGQAEVLLEIDPHRLTDRYQEMKLLRIYARNRQG